VEKRDFLEERDCNVYSENKSLMHRQIGRGTPTRKTFGSTKTNHRTGMTTPGAHAVWDNRKGIRMIPSFSELTR